MHSAGRASRRRNCGKRLDAPERTVAGFQMTKSRAPAWLMDDALEQRDALGRDSLRLLRRRLRGKQGNTCVEVDVGPRLRVMIARLERQDAVVGKIEQ